MRLAGLRRFMARVFNVLAHWLTLLGAELLRQGSRELARGEPRSLYETPRGDRLWLNQTGHVDRIIRLTGQFEPASTAVVERLVKPGSVVVDVGANIGYYTVILSRLVGPQGRVIAFEPTRHFLETLRRNLSENGVTNVEVVEMGLSDRAGTQRIDITPSSATMHSPPGLDAVVEQEDIRLTTLDEYVAKEGVRRIDFVKIDVDGHEPLVFDGAWAALDALSPVVLCEVSHAHYLQAGRTAWDFFDSVRHHGYIVHDEHSLEPITTRETFLRRCGNFDRGANIVLSKAPLRPNPAG